MKKILFIEDEPALQQTLGDFLKGQWYAVVAALDGEAGLAAIKSERPDLVLLDLILPRKHGLDVLREMRADPSIAAIPVIVLTNIESGDAIKEATELGARAYLIKTNYSLDEVLEKVKAVIG
ncbi:MAG: response regulator [bacterium]|nr:response regulator [bacterium]